MLEFSMSDFRTNGLIHFLNDLLQENTGIAGNINTSKYVCNKYAGEKPFQGFPSWLSFYSGQFSYMTGCHHFH